jgi:hypothetical protein
VCIHPRSSALSLPCCALSPHSNWKKIQVIPLPRPIDSSTLPPSLSLLFFLFFLDSPPPTKELSLAPTHPHHNHTHPSLCHAQKWQHFVTRTTPAARPMLILSSKSFTYTYIHIYTHTCILIYMHTYNIPQVFDGCNRAAQTSLCYYHYTTTRYHHFTTNTKYRRLVLAAVELRRNHHFTTPRTPTLCVCVVCVCVCVCVCVSVYIYYIQLIRI